MGGRGQAVLRRAEREGGLAREVLDRGDRGHESRSLGGAGERDRDLVEQSRGALQSDHVAAPSEEGHTAAAHERLQEADVLADELDLQRLVETVHEPLRLADDAVAGGAATRHELERRAHDQGAQALLEPARHDDGRGHVAPAERPVRGRAIVEGDELDAALGVVRDPAHVHGLPSQLHPIRQPVLVDERDARSRVGAVEHRSTSTATASGYSTSSAITIGERARIRRSFATSRRSALTAPPPASRGSARTPARGRRRRPRLRPAR